MNLLFISSRNQERSLTAKAIFSNYPDLNVKSAGTEDVAGTAINRKLLSWADLILVMEQKHKTYLLQHVGEKIKTKKIMVLDIPGVYRYKQPELIEELKDKINPYLQAYLGFRAPAKKRYSFTTEERNND